MELHHATVFEAIADALGDAPALAQGPRVLSWRQMDDRAARLAAALTDAGLTAQSTVAIDLYNCAEWMEAFYGTVKARLVPVSINYRYLDDELAYLFENCDAEALIFHASLGERVVRVARRFPRIKALIQVDDVGGAELPPGVLDYEEIMADLDPAPRIRRSPDDIVMWYSGGTTGLPKGVVIPIGASVEQSSGPEGRLRTLGRYDVDPATVPEDPVEHARLLWEEGTRPIAVPAAPLMHSTAMAYAGSSVLHCGGMIVTLEDHSFDPHRLFEAVDRHRVTTLAIVGDAFAKPMTRALEARAAEGRPYDGSSLRTICSAGVVWSADVKDRLFRHLPGVLLVDNCGSSEGAWYGTSILRKGDPTSSASFIPAPDVLLLDEDGEPMPPGTGKAGLLASTTPMSGYHNDPEKTAKTFRFIGDVWYTVPGDYGLFNDDGTVTLLGRGSSVINTGGEKVFPEEVDDVVKTLDEVDDCLVVGTPDERFGQAVTAVVQPRAGATVDPQAIVEHVRSKLAHYKAPRRIVVVDGVPRLPNGKPDYPETLKLAERAVAPSAAAPSETAETTETAEEAPTEMDVRTQVREWLAANWDPELTLAEWWIRLADSGWGYPTWPEEWFGRGLSDDDAVLVRAEFTATGALGPPHGIGQTMGAPVIMQFGTDEQKQRWLRALATGEEGWCQFFSEPNAGSDLAGLQTRAARDGDEWVVNGQKVWNSGTATAERAILVCRTDSNVPKHRGLSFFILDVEQPGIEVRPIAQLNGHAEFNETFLTDARVPDANRIGELNGGWAVTMATLANERTAYAAGADYGVGPAPGRRNGMLDLPVREAVEQTLARRQVGFPLGSTEAMVGLAREFGRDDDPTVRQRIAHLHCMAQTAKWNAARAKAAVDAGKAPGAESSLGHVAGVLIARYTRDLGLDLVGPHGTLTGEDAPHGGDVTMMALTSLVHGIQGGTEQIQRNIIGERVLGLPKEPAVDRDVPFRELLANSSPARPR
jgi:fatty-acyl-CoA synthase